MKYVTEVTSTSIINRNAIGSVLHSYSEAPHIQILAHEVDILTEITYGFSQSPCNYADATFKQEVTSYFASLKYNIPSHSALSYPPYTINKTLLRNV